MPECCRCRGRRVPPTTTPPPAPPLPKVPGLLSSHPPFPVVEGLKDLLVGPGVELLLTPREPALPVDPDSGGSTSPGVTASECGLGPRWGGGGGGRRGQTAGP